MKTAGKGSSFYHFQHTVWIDDVLLVAVKFSPPLSSPADGLNYVLFLTYHHHNLTEGQWRYSGQMGAVPQLPGPRVEQSDMVGLRVSLVRLLFFSTEDLWESLEKASGKPIAAVMNTWTKQMGFPLIYVEAEQVSRAIIPLIAIGLFSDQMFCLLLCLRSNLVVSNNLKTSLGPLKSRAWCSELLSLVAGLFLQGGEEEEPGGK